MKKCALPHVFSALAAVFFSTSLQANESAKTDSNVRSSYTVEPTLTDWKGDVGAKFNRGLQIVGDQVSSFIFDQIDSVGQNFHSGDFNLDARIRRQVFDNNNVQNTWSVADHIQLRGHVPFHLGELGQVAGSPFGFSIGAGVGLELINIRQVQAHTSEVFTKFNHSLDDLLKKGIYKDITESSDNSSSENKKRRCFSFYNEAGGEQKSCLQFDDVTTARFGKIWNVATIPYRLPLKAAWLDRLSDGEIFSWNGSGSVEFGPGIGWNVDLTGITKTFSASVGYRVYIRGEYRVTVLKENSRFVRVKVSRTKGFGHSISGGGSDARKSLIEGVIVLDRIRYSMFPFSISYGKEKGNTLETVYRYDLQNPAAVQAYENAMTGRFALSDELSAQEKPQTSSGVSKLATKNSLFKTETRGQGIRLAFISRRNSTSSATYIDAIIEFPDGKKQVLNSVAENSDLFKLFWGTYENMRYRFSTTLDKELAEKNDPQALLLNVEADIEDTFTSGEEMLAYMKEAEDAVGKKNIFPRLPVYSPEKSCTPKPAMGKQVDDAPRCHYPKYSYGRSKFYYQLYFNKDSIEKLKNYPIEKMWQALELSFGVDAGSWESALSRSWYLTRRVPLAVVNIPLFAFNYGFKYGEDLMSAYSTRQSWIQLHNSKNIETDLQSIADMFTSHKYSYQMVRLLRYINNEQGIVYRTSGYNRSFGRIFVQSETGLPNLPIDERIAKDIDFDKLPRPGFLDRDAQIQNLSVREINPTEIELTFTLPKAVVAVFFRVNYKTGYGITQETREAIIMNDGIFQQGNNRIVINRKNKQGRLYDLFKNLKNDQPYYVRTSATQQGLSWSPMSETKFNVNFADNQE